MKFASAQIRGRVVEDEIRETGGSPQVDCMGHHTAILKGKKSPGGF